VRGRDRTSAVILVSVVVIVIVIVVVIVVADFTHICRAAVLIQLVAGAIIVLVSLAHPLCVGSES
jgi:hypothetical protein